MRKSKYILTADDYGASDFIDNGIIKAIRNGKINSVACFAVPFGIVDDLDVRMQRLLDLRNEGFIFSIGLHLSLTAGRSNNEDVFRNGNSLTEFDFDEKRHYMQDAFKFRWGIDEGEMRDEMESQIQRLKSILGDELIDSISNHHGVVYIDSRLFKIYAEVASHHKIPLRSPVIWRKAGLPFRNWDGLPSNPAILQGVKFRFLNHLREAKDTESRIKIINELKIPYPTCLVDEIYGQPYPSNLKALFESYKLGTFTAEFMFHLGDPEYRVSKNLTHNEAFKLEEPWGIDAGYFGGRENELQILLDCTLPREDIQKINFRSLESGDEIFPDWTEV